MSFRRAGQIMNDSSALSQDMENRTCPACSRIFNTAQGLMSHLSSSKKCAWYRKGKRRQLEPLETEETEMTVEEEVGERTTGSIDGVDDGDPGNVLDELNDTLFQFIPMSATPHASTSTSTAHDGQPHIATTLQSAMRLDDDTDERVEDIDESAGKVIRMDATLQERWKRLFGGMDMNAMDVDMDEDPVVSNRWAPFASELDWRVAKWAVQEGVGHNAFDRLLAIPGVRTQFLPILIYAYHICSSLRRSRRN